MSVLPERKEEGISELRVQRKRERENTEGGPVCYLNESESETG